jgi:hypothetical protein
MKSIKVNNLIELVVGIEKEDFNEGSGIYGIQKDRPHSFTSDFYKVHFVTKIEDFNLRSKEELIELFDYSNNKKLLKELTQVCESGDIDWYDDDVEGKYEVISKECSIEYFNVEV